MRVQSDLAAQKTRSKLSKSGQANPGFEGGQGPGRPGLGGFRGVGGNSGQKLGPGGQGCLGGSRKGPGRVQRELYG